MDEVEFSPLSTSSGFSKISSSGVSNVKNIGSPNFELTSFHDLLTSTLDAHRRFSLGRARSSITSETTRKTAENSDGSQPGLPSLSHIEYRKVLKKVKRKMKRRIEAVSLAKEEREKRKKATGEYDGTNGAEKELEEEEDVDNDGDSNNITEQDELDEIERKLREHEAWIEREKRAKEEFEKKKAEEERQKEEEEKRRAEDELKREAEATESRNRIVAEETAKPKPPAPTDLNDPNNCDFFMRTGVCRYGEVCKRLHPEIEVGTKVLIPHMFDPPALEAAFSASDGDVTLDEPNEDLLKAFREFYEDTLPEFRKIGTVRQFKVCSNRVKHLRGNVYVEYEREEEAFVAAQVFGGRWYAGKQLSAHVTVVRSWRQAVCLQYLQNCCPKGKYCNFFHCFLNPDNEFAEADEESSSEPVEVRREPSGGLLERPSASWRKDGRLPPKWKRSPSPPGKHRPFRFRDHYVEDARIWKKGRNSSERTEEKGVWSDDEKDGKKSKKRAGDSDSEEEDFCDREKRRKREKRERHRRRSRSRSKSRDKSSDDSSSNSGSSDEMGKKILKATLKSMKVKKSKKTKKKKKKKKSKKKRSRDPGDSTDSSWDSDASGD